MAIPAKNTQPKKKWPRYAFIAAMAMAIIAAVLYLWMYIRIDREFSGVSDYYGDYYEELFALSTPDNDMKKEAMTAGSAALEFVGSETEREAFGLLSRYCASQPGAQKAEAELEVLAGKTDGNTGYLWIAYVQRIYDAEGNLLAASGSSEERILARWELEKLDGTWKVTEILEHP